MELLANLFGVPLFAPLPSGKLVILNADDPSEGKTYTDLFFFQKHIRDPLKTMRECAMYYLLTEKGQKYNASINECFNWGDFVSQIPQEIYQKFGFELMYDSDTVPTTNTTVLNVLHDELLGDSPPDLYADNFDPVELKDYSSVLIAWALILLDDIDFQCAVAWSENYDAFELLDERTRFQEIQGAIEQMPEDILLDCLEYPKRREQNMER